ncbi:MAG: hypothetical protein WA692_28765, partial [Paraburkholderia caledonica]
MAKGSIERSNQQRYESHSDTNLQRRDAQRPRSSRLTRGVACWLALQTALAAPLASVAEAAAAASGTAGKADTANS